MSIDTVLDAARQSGQFLPVKAELLKHARNDLDLKWLTAFEVTIDNWIGARLEETSPVVFAYDPSLFDEHINRAYALLEQCIARRLQIVEIETQAVAAALTYLTERAVEESETAIAKLEVKAARVQASANSSDASEQTVERLLRLRQGLRSVRTVMHSDPGNPMNFDERIRLLRDILERDIRTVYELLLSARSGLHVAVGLRVPPVPAWNKSDTENLRKLVVWCMDVMRQFDHGKRTERVVQRVLRLGRNSLVAGNLRTLVLNSSEKFVDLPFGISYATLDLPVDVPCRLLSLAFAVEMDEANALARFKDSLSKDEKDRAQFDYINSYYRSLREKMLFSLDVTLPYQREINGHMWQRPLLELRNEIRIWQNYENEIPATNRLPQVRNTHPVGDWKLRFYTNFSGPDYPGNLSSLTGGDKRELLDFKDIVVWLRLAVRD